MHLALSNQGAYRRGPTQKIAESSRQSALSSRHASSLLWPVAANRRMDEDCLHLTITAPAKVSLSPVMVWFRGGAFISGSGDLDCYAPVDLARDHGVVCVNVSHRLGVFGYLMIPGIAPVNLGLLDQRKLYVGFKPTSPASVGTQTGSLS